MGSGASVSVLAAASVAILISVFADRIGGWLGVMASPDGDRRRHARPTPQVGGIAIMLPVMAWAGIALALGLALEQRFLTSVLICGTGAALVGFVDDQQDTSPLSRTLLLIVFLIAAFVIEPRYIASALHWGIFPATPIWTPVYFALMIVTAVGLVNAVNMADGQDGLVGSMFVIWSLCLVIAGRGTTDMLATVLAGTAVAFLAFNLFGRLFLGDAGTYGVTFVIGLMVTLAHARGTLPLDVIVVWFFIPVVDCLRLIVSRSLRGMSPFLGDRDHFHHRLEDCFGQRAGLIIYVGTVAVTSLGASLVPALVLYWLACAAIVYCSFTWLPAWTAVADGDAFEADEEFAISPLLSKVIQFSGEVAERSHRERAETDADLDTGEPARLLHQRGARSSG